MRDGKKRKDIRLTWWRCDLIALSGRPPRRIVIFGGSRLSAPSIDSGGRGRKGNRRKQATPSSLESTINCQRARVPAGLVVRVSDMAGPSTRFREETLRPFVSVRPQDAHGAPWRPRHLPATRMGPGQDIRLPKERLRGIQALPPAPIRNRFKSTKPGAGPCCIRNSNRRRRSREESQRDTAGLAEAWRWARSVDRMGQVAKLLTRAQRREGMTSLINEEK
ncbi:hypothetical protein LZ30DRAFT_162764 [Colletotrichum cereale]|nr:hypothetical protein LZ30DRAFT_162764 [Colletotrichum cereale]